MKKFFLTIFILEIFFISGCKTIETKSSAILKKEEALKKENEKLSKFLQQPESEL